ncbi:uncharacterized protein (DUF952 family) [Nocardioides daedukensis]|uniref:Uncharacterized protein (DUF952 family) n=1 Tax=Nocardioides daedukensis TaxID=634462 RepID=A0A7Y9S3Z9_9ACTN|nr:DUF952 domain-containing protein [Nocardioides daedukensis]NYG60604.1 uncharacterized protein (DUF952 family) [Nocardioides daedukensis]
MLIFHIAEKSRWDAARLAGSYAQSTLDRTLEEEGFIHASREDQVEGVRERYYADVRTPLVLLTIDTEKLTSPWSEDEVGDTTYPHIHGPINPSAVVAVEPLGGQQARPQRSFMGEFLAEFSFRIAAAIVVMVVASACGFLGVWLWGDSAGLWALLVGAALSTAAMIALYRRRERRLAG